MVKKGWTMPLPFYRTKRGKLYKFLSENPQTWFTVKNLMAHNTFGSRTNIQGALDDFLTNGDIRKYITGSGTHLYQFIRREDRKPGLVDYTEVHTTKEKT